MGARAIGSVAVVLTGIAIASLVTLLEVAFAARGDLVPDVRDGMSHFVLFVAASVLPAIGLGYGVFPLSAFAFELHLSRAMRVWVYLGLSIPIVAAIAFIGAAYVHP